MADSRLEQGKSEASDTHQHCHTGPAPRPGGSLHFCSARVMQTEALNVEAGPGGGDSEASQRQGPSQVFLNPLHTRLPRSRLNPSHRGPPEVPGCEKPGGQAPASTTEPAACQQLLRPLPGRLLAVITILRWPSSKHMAQESAQTRTQMTCFRHTTRSVSTPATHPAHPGVQWGLPPPRHPPVREAVTSQGHVLTEQLTLSFPLCGQQAGA